MRSMGSLFHIFHPSLLVFIHRKSYIYTLLLDVIINSGVNLKARGIAQRHSVFLARAR